MLRPLPKGSRHLVDQLTGDAHHSQLQGSRHQDHSDSCPHSHSQVPEDAHSQPQVDQLPGRCLDAMAPVSEMGALRTRLQTDLLSTKMASDDDDYCGNMMGKCDV